MGESANVILTEFRGPFVQMVHVSKARWPLQQIQHGEFEAPL